MFKKIINFFKEDEGASLVEYALLVALIAAFCIGAIRFLGQNASSTLNSTAGVIGSQAPLAYEKAILFLWNIYKDNNGFLP